MNKKGIFFALAFLPILLLIGCESNKECTAPKKNQDLVPWMTSLYSTSSHCLEVAQKNAANGSQLHAQTVLFGFTSTERFEVLTRELKTGVLTVCAYQDQLGFNGLHHSIQYGVATAIKSCLKNGAAVNAENVKGETPLFLAVEKDNVEVLKMLIQEKSNPSHIRRSGHTALHVAVMSKAISSAKHLVKISPDLMMLKDKNLMTPCELAMSLGETGIGGIVCN